MLRIEDAGQPIDLLTLKDDLGRRGDLDEVGGPAYLSALIDGVPRSANVEAYAAVVGEKARLRSAIMTAQKLSAQAYEAVLPAADMAADAAERLYTLGGDGLEGKAYTLGELVAPGIQALEDAAAHGSNGVTGVATGFTKLDQMTAGLQAGDLILIAARTSQGKTALALNIARAVGVPVLGFSLEMTRQQLFLRLLAAEAGVDSHRLRTGLLEDGDWVRIGTALGTLTDLPIRIDDTPGIGIREVRARARQVQAKHGLGCVFVDYIQLMVGRGAFDNRTQEIGGISRGLKRIAKELHVPIIALAQLSRAAEQKAGQRARRPQLSDLAESGSLENDADVVLLIYRPEPTEANPEPLAEIIIAKQRNGPPGVVKLAWNGACVRFENLSGGV